MSSLYFAGLKLFIGVTCVACALFQCVLLIDNFNAKDTLRKNQEVLVRGPMATPLVVVCSDPPLRHAHTDIVTTCQDSARQDLDTAFTVTRINTLFKVQTQILSNYEDVKMSASFILILGHLQHSRQLHPDQ